jgi:hypothetical protein
MQKLNQTDGENMFRRTFMCKLYGKNILEDKNPAGVTLLSDMYTAKTYWKTKSRSIPICLDLPIIALHL